MTDPYTSPPKNKAELLTWIDQEWNLLQNTIKDIGVKQMSHRDQDGWAIKDNLAHLAEWERYLVLNHLRRNAPGEVMGIPEAQIAQMNEDEINHVLYLRHRDQTAQEILAMLQESHTQVLAELAQWSFEDLAQPRFEDEEEKPSVGLFVAGNTYFHYREHREAIEKLSEKFPTDRSI